MSENIISEREAERINRMRDLLIELGERAKAEGWLVTDEDFSLGRFAGYVEVAEDALFTVLNVASSHLHCKAAETAIHEHLAEQRARTEARNA